MKFNSSPNKALHRTEIHEWFSKAFYLIHRHLAAGELHRYVVEKIKTNRGIEIKKQLMTIKTVKGK
jgi:hypothetical protein